MFMFLERWHDILPCGGGHVVSVYGGGGKTSLLEAMCSVLLEQGAAVCVTTTTRTEPLDWPGLVILEHKALLTGAVAPAGAPIFVRDGEVDGKWRGLSPAAVDALGGILPGHVILVEADGSAGRPVKLHHGDDPDLPRRTSLAIPVIGLSAIGRPSSAVLHRQGRVADDRLCLVADEPWSWEQMIRLLARPDGYLGRIPEGVPVAIALLQMDECDDALGLFECVGRIMEELDVPVVVMGDTSGPAPRLRTACLVDSTGEADDDG